MIAIAIIILSGAVLTWAGLILTVFRGYQNKNKKWIIALALLSAASLLAAGSYYFQSHRSSGNHVTLATIPGNEEKPVPSPESNAPPLAAVITFPEETPEPTPTAVLVPTPQVVAPPTPKPTPTSDFESYPLSAIITDPTASPTPEPSATPASTPQIVDDNAWLTDARKKFSEGEIAFNSPVEMNLNKTETFEARLTGRTGNSALTEGLPGKGEPLREKLKISLLMKVSLKAPKDQFQIDPITEEERALDPESPYESWKWSVTPLKGDELALHLIAEAKVDFPGKGERTLYVKTYDHKVKVNVNNALTSTSPKPEESKQGKESQMGTASWVFGSILLAFAMGITIFRLWGPDKPVDATADRILGILCSLLSGLFAFFFTGNFTASGSVKGFAVQAVGGGAIFIVVLLWWKGEKGPLKDKTAGADSDDPSPRNPEPVVGPSPSDPKNSTTG